MEYLNGIDNLGKGWKIIISILFLDLFWGAYRIVKSCVMPPKMNVAGLVLGILSCVFFPVWWLFDFVCLIAFGKIAWFA